MNTDIRTQPKVRTTLICTVANAHGMPVLKAKRVLISVWLLFGRWAPRVPREVLEAN